ncbi:DUF4282 domain-containing protein [Shewanella olleyana]|uniref:DUF4282 domain-containing protein n=1 Tax=Shewanella olleyana TaxID=135626 RepID=UPI0031FF32C7
MVFLFESMLTPKIITFVYWILLISAGFSGVSTIFFGYEGVSFYSLMLGLFITGTSAITARIFCELVIVLFKMNESLQIISKNPDLKLKTLSSSSYAAGERKMTVPPVLKKNNLEQSDQVESPNSNTENLEPKSGFTPSKEREPIPKFNLDARK